MTQQGDVFDQDPMDLHQYVIVLVRKWWVIAFVFIVVLSGSVVFSLMQRDVFEVEVKLLITVPVAERLTTQLSSESNPNAVGVPAGADLSNRTLAALTISSDVLEAVIRELNLRNGLAGDLWDVEQLVAMIEPEVVRGERDEAFAVLPLITITVRGGDPQQIKRIADKWTEVFIRENTELFISESARSFQFVEERYQDIQTELQKKQQEIVDDLHDNPLPILRIQLEVFTRKLSDFLTQLESKRADLVSSGAELASATQELAKETPFITIQRSMAGDAILEFLSRSPEAPKVASLPDLVVSDQERNELYHSLKATVASLSIKTAKLFVEINDLDERTANLRLETENLYTQIAAIEINVSRLDNEIEVLSKNSSTLAQRLQDALIAKAEQGGVIRVVQAAVEPVTPVSHNRLRNILLAAALGLLMGVVAAFVVHSYESSQSSSEN